MQDNLATKLCYKSPVLFKEVQRPCLQWIANGSIEMLWIKKIQGQIFHKQRNRMQRLKETVREKENKWQ